MICKKCKTKINSNLDKCPICDGKLSKSEDLQDLPDINEDNNAMFNPKFLVVLAIAILFIVLVKTLFFPNVENMPTYKMEYGKATIYETILKA